MIEHYTFGSIRIDGKEYNHDVIVNSAGGVKSWRRRTSHEVTIDDLEPILAEKPEMVIFGTGASGVMKVFPESEEYLANKGIKVKILRTSEAAKEFNQYLKTPNVVGAFHLTC